MQIHVFVNIRGQKGWFTILCTYVRMYVCTRIPKDHYLLRSSIVIVFVLHSYVLIVV